MESGGAGGGVDEGGEEAPHQWKGHGVDGGPTGRMQEDVNDETR